MSGSANLGLVKSLMGVREKVVGTGGGVGPISPKTSFFQTLFSPTQTKSIAVIVLWWAIARFYVVVCELGGGCMDARGLACFLFK